MELCKIYKINWENVGSIYEWEADRVAAAVRRHVQILRSTIAEEKN